VEKRNDPLLNYNQISCQITNNTAKICKNRKNKHLRQHNQVTIFYYSRSEAKEAAKNCHPCPISAKINYTIKHKYDHLLRPCLQAEVPTSSHLVFSTIRLAKYLCVTGRNNKNPTRLAKNAATTSSRSMLCLPHGSSNPLWLANRPERHCVDLTKKRPRHVTIFLAAYSNSEKLRRIGFLRSILNAVILANYWSLGSDLLV
jgi:hypothetical protein